MKKSSKWVKVLNNVLQTFRKKDRTGEIAKSFKKEVSQAVILNDSASF
jgi:hypothetical protein